MGAVDEDVVDADGVFVGLFEGGAAGDGLGVEDGDVGEVVFFDEAAVAEVEVFGGEAGDFADAGFESEHFFGADVAGEEFGIAGVEEAAGFAEAHEDGVGGDGDFGVFEGGEAGALGEVVVGCGHGFEDEDFAVFFEEEVAGGVEGVFAELFGHGGEGHAFVGFVFFGDDGHDAGALPAHDFEEVEGPGVVAGVGPGELAVEDVVEHALAQFAAADAVEDGFAVVVEGPRGEEGEEVGEAGGGGHDVHADVDAFAAEVVEAVELFGDFGVEGDGWGPVVGEACEAADEGAEYFADEAHVGDPEDVGDLGADVVGFGDFDDFADGLAEGVGVAAEVAGEDGVVFAEDFAEFDEFASVAFEPREVLEAGGEADAALVEALVEVAGHDGDFVVGGGAAFEAEGVDADEAVGGEEGGVHEEALALAEGDVFGGGTPCDFLREVHGGEGFEVVLDAARVAFADGRQGHAAVAADEGGDALADERLEDGLVVGFVDRQVGVGVAVDEAWGDDAAGGVDDALRGGAVRLADEGDFIAGNGDVGLVSIRAGSVDYRSVFDEDVEHDVISFEPLTK